MHHVSERPSMSRAVRTVRGVFGALVVTLLAATSHALAGGLITLLAVLTTAVLTLPLTVLLAGKVGSLWRLTLAVVPAQFAYHWSFAGLGIVTAPRSADAGPVVSAHAAHLGMLSASLPADLVAAGAADATMWLSHALASVVTIALLHRGEHAALALARVLGSALPVKLPQLLRLPERPAILALFETSVRRQQQNFLSAISYRGPPALAFTTN